MYHNTITNVRNLNGNIPFEVWDKGDFHFIKQLPSQINFKSRDSGKSMLC